LVVCSGETGYWKRWPAARSPMKTSSAFMA
jgi:hypothetical protein